MSTSIFPQRSLLYVSLDYTLVFCDVNRGRDDVCALEDNIQNVAPVIVKKVLLRDVQCL